QLLDSPEQHLLAQLGVFLGGWTVEVARAISLSELQPYEEILNRLEDLVNQSLVVHHPKKEGANVEEPFGRFSLLGMVREYALARLRESGQMEYVQQRHAQYYLALVEGSEPDLYG